MTTEYRLIRDHYGDRTAKRSGVRLMNHIDQGLAVLEAIGAADTTQRAFCLHPLLQNDEDLLLHYPTVCVEARPAAILLAMEYRSVANAWLSDKVYTVGIEEGHFGPFYHKIGEPRLSPIPAVNEMLVADKVQNYKDFVIYHSEHPRRFELSLYFDTWLEVLGVSKAEFNRLCAIMDT